MPKFILQGQDDPRFSQLDPFTRAYIEAAIFTEEENLGPLGTTAVQQLADSTIAAMVFDCARFQRAAKVDEIPDHACARGTGEYSVQEQAGHDLWMTRTGQGCGYWDGDWAEPWASRLDALAKRFGSIDLYRGRDGRIYQ